MKTIFKMTGIALLFYAAALASQKEQKIQHLIAVAENAEIVIVEKYAGIELEITCIDSYLKEKLQLRDFFEGLKTQTEDFLKCNLAILNQEFAEIGILNFEVGLEETEVNND